MKLNEFRKKYPNHINIVETSKLTGVHHGKIKKLIKLHLINPIVLDRIRLNYYLLSPDDVEVVKSLKDKLVRMEGL